jgi:glycosyltransferase involved in cell wall biosynthesis
MTTQGSAQAGQERLREICWEVGESFGVFLGEDQIVLAAVKPRLGYLCWGIEESSVAGLKRELGHDLHGAALVLRVYDVTDILFDGFNAHGFFDLDAGGLRGNTYVPIHRLERNLMAEIGFRLPDGAFHALARSSPVYFDRDRPSGRVHLGGMYVGRKFQRTLSIENVLDAPVYERLNFELDSYLRSEPLVVAVVHKALDAATGVGGRLGPALDELGERCGKFHVEVRRFGDKDSAETVDPGATLAERAAAEGESLFAQLKASHRKRPLDLVHCHDWQSVPVGRKAARELGLPLVVSLHSTEHERSRGAEMQDQVAAIADWERSAVRSAGLVIVPHSSTRQQVIGLYQAPEDKVLIIPDILEEQQGPSIDPVQERRVFGLNPDWPVLLFSGEVSHATGADLLLDALISVTQERGAVQCIFAGEGPLKGELQSRAWHAGLGDLCRFFGDVAADAFEHILVASDFVVIPARTWQDEGLAQLAVSRGKPVLTTHQSHIHCIAHGQNGLITYDNPGSIVWGIKELLANPLQGNMIRSLARQRASHTQSLESVAAEHYLAYERVLADAKEAARG